jgi:lipid II:glycine glycyltransferase (peptidoglycan interpeptide bridge formation enzyme)
MEAYQGAAWNDIIAGLPEAHILQTWEWGQFKAAYGWQPLPQVWGEYGRVSAAAMVLERKVPGGLRVLYAPRGPLVDWEDVPRAQRVLRDLQGLARKRGAIFIKIDPELVTGYGIPGSEEDRENPGGVKMLAALRDLGWRCSQEQVQFRNTAWLDISGEEDNWLARMKQKTRYNLRLAQRKGVQVRLGGMDDLPLLYRLYAGTSVRDGFVIRPEDYYLKVWRAFIERGLAEPLLAEVEGEVVAGLVLFSFAGRAWYLYGMSSQSHREKMPNYLLQWEAMRRAKARGCRVYDLWGAPEVFAEGDPLWGVFRFKEGLGSTVVRTSGAWDFPARPQLYLLYTRILPRILDLMRRRGRQRTRSEVVL